MDIKVWSFNEKILTQPKFEVDYCAYIASDPCIFGRGKTPTIARVNAEKGFVKAGLK